MTTHLSITTVFTDGRVERTEHDWPGWDLEAAASIDRAHHHADTGDLTYLVPLTARHRADGVLRMIRSWSDITEPVQVSSTAQ